MSFRVNCAAMGEEARGWLGRRMLLDSSRRIGAVGYWHSTDFSLHCVHSGLASSHLILRVLQEKQPFRDFLWERRVRLGASVLGCLLLSRKLSSGDVLPSSQSWLDQNAPGVNSSLGVSIDMSIFSMMRKVQQGREPSDVNHGNIARSYRLFTPRRRCSPSHVPVMPCCWKSIKMSSNFVTFASGF